MKKVILSGLLVLLLCLFSFLLFKNIGYPLLWNDEGETAMFGQRVLEYGYPKVHGEKNVVYTLARGDKEVGIKEENDLFVAVGPAQYYFATLGLRWAQGAEDIYAKTARLRVPFALIGALGVGLISWGLAGFFQSKVAKLSLLVLFVFFETLSVPLFLHLRQVRYYPLVIFLVGAIVLTYLRYRYQQQWPWWLYVPLMIILFLLAAVTYYPVFLILGLGLGLNEVREAWQRRERGWFGRSGRVLLPLLLALILAIPFLVYFETFRLSGELSDGGFLNFEKLQENVGLAWEFFRYQAYGYLLVVVWGVLFWLWANSKNKKLKQALGLRKSAAETLVLLALVYWLVMLRVPHLFERYYIVLQPLLIGVLLLNLSIAWRLIMALKPVGERKKIKLAFLGVVLVVFVFNSYRLPKLYGQYLGELTNPVKGPVDYAVEFVRENYSQPEDLVVAANYEEASFMYYLGSRVIIGYAGANLEEDLKLTPEVVFIRRAWERADFTPDEELIRGFLTRAEYREVALPVLDFFVNNMPESGIHVFKTVELENDLRQARIYVRE